MSQLLRHLDNLDNILEKSFTIPTLKRIIRMNWGGSVYFIDTMYLAYARGVFKSDKAKHLMWFKNSLVTHESKIVSIL